MRDNSQPPEKRQSMFQLGHQKLDVHSIFYTIQGEGPFAGTPAVFVRLAGCNLQCPKCDTDYTSKRRWMTPDEVVGQIQWEAQRYETAQEALIGIRTRQDASTEAYKNFRGLVVITGGEPFRQESIELLALILVQRGFYVQVETNGTLPAPDLSIINKDVSQRKGLYIVVSPKAGKVHPATEAVACAYKYVMASNSVSPVDGLPVHVLDHTLGSLRVARPPEGFTGPVYLQPMDEQDKDLNEAHLRTCIRSCMKHGYILQLQIHKILGME